MIRLTVSYNDGFELVPNANPLVDFDKYFENSSELLEFISNLDYTGVKTIKIVPGVNEQEND